jgi:hypothetical protein
VLKLKRNNSCSNLSEIAQIGLDLSKLVLACFIGSCDVLSKLIGAKARTFICRLPYLLLGLSKLVQIGLDLPDIVRIGFDLSEIVQIGLNLSKLDLTYLKFSKLVLTCLNYSNWCILVQTCPNLSKLVQFV